MKLGRWLIIEYVMVFFCENCEKNLDNERFTVRILPYVKTWSYILYVWWKWLGITYSVITK